MANIYNRKSNTLLSGTSDADLIQNGGYWNSKWHDGGSNVTINAGTGNDDIVNYLGEYVKINSGDGNDYIYIYDDSGYCSINAGAGNDTITNESSNVTIDAGAGNDIIEIFNREVSIDGGAGNDDITNYDSNVTINASDGNDTISNGGSNSSIEAGEGDDKIWNFSDQVTIEGGAGNDTIQNFGTGTMSGGDGADRFVFYYDSDILHDTNTITDYAEDDTIRFYNVAVSKVSTTSAGSVIFKAGDNKLVVKNAADKIITYIDADGSTKTFGEKKSWKLDGTTATYGSLTVKGVTSLDGLKLSGKVLTVSATSLGTEKISVSDGYTLKLGSDVSSSTTKKSWTLSNSTATYKQTTTAGYSLADNEIIYSKKATKTLVTVKGVTSTDGLKVSGKVVTVSAASLDTSKVTVSDGYTLKLGSDVSSSTTKKSWTFKNSTATYKQTTSAGYSFDGNEIIYSKKSSKTLATVKGVTSTDGLSVSGKTIKLAASALSKKVTVSGGYTFDFASDYSKASITGSSSSDTIIARGKNISLSGGAGADIFAVKPSVANVISDYESEDKISLTSGAAEISTDGDDLIFNGKLTVAGAADKVVTYIEGGVEKIFKKASDAVQYNAAGTAATLTATYEEDTFTANSTLATINASAVNYGLSIIGNKRANKITGTSEDDYIDGQGSGDTLIGGGGNDTLVGGTGNDSLVGGSGNDSHWGGAGDDTLLGGGGKDIFVYRDGDGDDIISGYESIDIIKIFSDNEVNAPTTDTAGNVTFKIGGGQITFENAADKYIELFIGDSNNTYDKKYRPAGK